jgi:uncharacterized iron-regulated membrane protein
MKINVRTVFFQIHLWTGLIVGLFLLIGSVTGAMLVFYPEIKDHLHPELFHVTPGAHRLTIDAIVAKLEAQHPDERPSDITLSSAADSTAVLDLVDGKEAFMNPYTGEAIEVGNVKRGDFLRQVEYLHRFLLMGDTGKRVIDFATLASLLMLATGVCLWWPSTWRMLKKSLKLDLKKKNRGWWVNLHEVIGMYSLIVVFILAFTALPISYGWFKRSVFFSATGSAEPALAPKSHIKQGAPRIPMQAAWDRLEERIPDYRLARLYFPKKPAAPIYMYAIATDAPHVNARSFLYVDAYSGEVLRYDPYASHSLGERMYLWTLPLHLGQVGGLAGRLIAMTGSLSMGGLVVTGAWLYYRRKLRPVRRTASVPPASASRSGMRATIQRILPDQEAGARSTGRPARH